MATVQIFLSYARLDDEPPPDVAEAKGFVTYLHEQLRYELQVLGQPQPKIWRDVRHVESGDQFDPVIGDALTDSSLLLVVLSRNWPHRPYCVRELETFAKRWRGEGEESVKSRVVVVSKHYIKPEERPPLLQGQEGFDFFALDADAGVGQEKEFFYRGQVRDPRYEVRVRDLARFLWRTADRVGAGAPAPAGGAMMSSGNPPPPPQPPKSGRVIYLAKPATDMREGYFRLVEELQRRDYAIVPDPAAEIPSDTSATAFVDQALAEAEIAIHLLGEKSGYAPEEADPIVKLQLARAGTRVPAETAEGDAERAFRRIVWAPKVLEDRAGEQAPAARDPLAVLARFDRHIPTDKVEGDTLSKFVDFLVQHLARSAPPRVLPEEIKADARVYLYHSREDSDYVLSLAEALHERKIELIYPVFDGPPAEIAEFHHNNLVACDAVVMCWYQASEVWVRAQSSGWKDWHGLGRNERFAYRGLVAGPPPGDRKKFFVRLKRGDFDLVVDLTAPDQPLSEALDPLVRIERPAGS